MHVPTHKLRSLYENFRKTKLDVPSCNYCGRWGSQPEDSALAAADTPVACVYPTSEQIADYEYGLTLDPYHVMSHKLHQGLGIAECNASCEIPNEKPKSKSLIKSIKSKLKVEDIAERLTPLRGYGSKLNGKCPLHSEQNGASFNVWLDTQSWYCFGQCAKGGDVLDLIQAAHEAGLSWRKE